MPNLLSNPEDLSGGAWGGGFYSITTDTDVAPNGTTTADTLDMQETYTSFSQALIGTAVPSTQYTFSFFAKRGTAADVKLSVYDFSNGGDIVPSSSYYADINGSSFTRVVQTFTTPAGCDTIGVYPVRDSGALGTVKLWGVWLNLGSTPDPYPGVGAGFNPAWAMGSNVVIVGD